jgi:hypothetical protein
MAKTARYYQRLTRSRAGLGTYTSLWLGPDHLLLVTSSGYSESYQRFYFRDIQCLVIGESPRFALFNAILGCILLFCAIPALILAGTGSGVSPWILLPVVPTVLFLIYNLALGPTCRVTLMTGVQTLRLRPLSRRRRARKVIARLAPLVEAAQAALVPPPLTPPPPAMAAPLPPAEPPAAVSSPDPSDPAEDLAPPPPSAKRPTAEPSVQ